MSKKTTSKKKYSKGAGKKVAKVMREFKEGKLTSGRSKKKVTSRKQAVAIGLSEARKAGAKVPAPRKRSSK
ncbi:hypothetical protein HYT05_00030 [Candidatus Kaiserbacteria bacterium]|nr:hypothetical protein [Candidatus Kaiserbacteria bacterium]